MKEKALEALGQGLFFGQHMKRAMAHDMNLVSKSAKYAGIGAATGSVGEGLIGLANDEGSSGFLRGAIHGGLAGAGGRLGYSAYKSGKMANRVIKNNISKSDEFYNRAWKGIQQKHSKTQNLTNPSKSIEANAALDITLGTPKRRVNIKKARKHSINPLDLAIKAQIKEQKKKPGSTYTKVRREHEIRERNRVAEEFLSPNHKNPYKNQIGSEKSVFGSGSWARLLK